MYFYNIVNFRSEKDSCEFDRDDWKDKFDEEIKYVKKKYEEKLTKIKADSATKVDIAEVNNLKKELHEKNSRITELENVQETPTVPNGAQLECSICCEEVIYFLFQIDAVFRFISV